MKAKLRVVEGGKKPSIFDDLEALRILPDEEDPVEATEVLRPKREPAKRSRLSRSTDPEDPFSRVWFSWFARYPGFYPPHIRLWQVLWYRSREGTEPVQITQEIAREARISLENRDRHARLYERLGMVRVERQPGQLLTLHILVRPPAADPPKRR